MANVCFTCGSFCVYLVIFLRISSVLCKSDLYFFDSEGSSHRSARIDLELLDDEDEHVHRYQKREAPDPSCTEQSILNDTQSTISTSTTTTTTTTVKPTASSKKQFEKPQPILERKKKVGVNGTGQKIDITPKVTVSPIMILNNTVPMVINKTEDDELLPSKFDTECGEREFNKTLHNHNITTSEMDKYEYYNSSFYGAEDTARHYWVDFENQTDVKVNELLSNSHRRAATVKLSFDFPFYGHMIKNVTIATGGFLYTGDYVHSWLAATQYIAPLMANFDTSISNNSFIKYRDNGTDFTVLWQDVALQERPEQGEFTFQVTLKKNGDIYFVYKNVPLLVRQIQDSNHPVKVGLSDAYILDRTVFLIRRKTIFEYHRVDFTEHNITNWTAIYLKALPTCLDNHDCITCLTRKVFTRTKCVWCPTLNRCSNGFDRHRQHWTAQGCDKKGLEREAECSQILNGNNEFDNFNNVEDSDTYETSRAYSSPVKKQQDAVGISGIVAILFLIAMISGLVLWIFYAYRNPHTTSGQILIRYRPSQWRWRRGEARYTAATIHM